MNNSLYTTAIGNNSARNCSLMSQEGTDNTNFLKCFFMLNIVAQSQDPLFESVPLQLTSVIIAEKFYYKIEPSQNPHY